jgi:hypothetical protein
MDEKLPGDLWHRVGLHDLERGQLPPISTAEVGERIQQLRIYRS